MLETDNWYERKPFLHFDLPLSKKEAVAYATCQRNVIRHPFYPLIRFPLLQPRTKKISSCGSVTFNKVSKERAIAYPAHKDGYIFSYYKSILERCYENWIQENGLEHAITAFRRTGKNNIHLAKDAFDFIRATPGCLIIATDVEAFFDTIHHGCLKETWAKFLDLTELPEDHYAVFKAITRFSTVEKYKVYNLFRIRLTGITNRTRRPKRICTPQQFRRKVIPRGLVIRNPGLPGKKGIPQGSQISPLLSNMYLSSLDLEMHNAASKLQGRYWRYCDDVLMVIPPNHSRNMLDRLDSNLDSLSLKRSEAKTQVIAKNDLSFSKQIQYLGFTFNGSETMIRPSSIHRYHRKAKKAMKATQVRRERESKQGGQEAPFRRQAILNMYSELPVRGVKIRARQREQKYKGNFTHYMDRAAEILDSPRIKKQRAKVLKRLRRRINGELLKNEIDIT